MLSIYLFALVGKQLPSFVITSAISIYIQNRVIYFLEILGLQLSVSPSWSFSLSAEICLPASLWRTWHTPLAFPSLFRLSCQIGCHYSCVYREVRWREFCWLKTKCGEERIIEGRINAWKLNAKKEMKNYHILATEVELLQNRICSNTFMFKNCVNKMTDV